MTATETMGLANLSKEEIDEIKERQAAEAFDKARSVMGEVGAGADSIVAVGDPADEIILAAKTRGYDHIVMGSRGLSPVKELLLGSVSDRVAREAHCPVTIIRG
jgi:nucleotide-binding universal stress UspA family protein